MRACSTCKLPKKVEPLARWSLASSSLLEGASGLLYSAVVAAVAGAAAAAAS
jgi:hypothetical protein